jgi:hypothetical protein
MDAEQRLCPKCGWTRESGAVECPACGIVFARFDNPPRPSSPGLPAEARNPYAPPVSDVRGPELFAQPPGGGVWRTGDLLVLQKGAVLPDRCLVCNGPMMVQWPKRLYWHHPGLYLLILLNIVIYAVAAMMARKKADLVIPLCSEHDRKRRRAVSTSWLTGLGGLLLVIGSCTQIESSESTFVVMLAIGLTSLLAGLTIAMKGNPVLPKKIDNSYVWLKKVHSSYLASLPPAPPGL